MNQPRFFTDPFEARAAARAKACAVGSAVGIATLLDELLVTDTLAGWEAILATLTHLARYDIGTNPCRLLTKALGGDEAAKGPEREAGYLDDAASAASYAQGDAAMAKIIAGLGAPALCRQTLLFLHHLLAFSEPMVSKQINFVLQVRARERARLIA